jgi:tight adherence protein C
MQIIQILVLVGISAAAACLVAIATTRAFPDHGRRRLQAVFASDAPPANPVWHAFRNQMVRLARLIGRISGPAQQEDPAPVRIKLLNAGLSAQMAMPLYFGAKTLLALVLPGSLLAALTLSGRPVPTVQMMALLLAASTLGYYLPAAWLSHRIEKRQREIFESFPDATDLMMVCIEAGLGLDAALARVAGEIRTESTACADELQRVILEMRAGAQRSEALGRLAMRTGVEEVAVFASMLAQAERFGSSIGDSLRVFSEEMRVRRRQRVEELAAKIPLKLLFPLVFCILPSLFLVLLGPAFIEIYRVLLPIMNGQS